MTSIDELDKTRKGVDPDNIVPGVAVAMLPRSEAGLTPVEPLLEGGVLDDVRVCAATTIQRLFRCRHARRQLRALLGNVFEKFYDDDSGLYYYHNKRTGETTWDKPKVLRPGEDMELSGVYGTPSGDSANVSKTAAMATDGMTLEEVDGEGEGNGGSELQDGGEKADTEKEEVAGEENVDEEAEGEEDDIDDDDDDTQESQEDRDELGYTQRERELARQQFDHVDADKSGSISAKELLKLLQSIGEQVTLKIVEDMIKSVDANSTGEVEFDEFLMILRRQQGKNQYAVSLELALLFGPKELENLKRQFMKLDLDASGSIDEHEIQALIKKLGRKVEDYDLAAMLREVDADGSGSIGFSEFLQIVATMMKDSESTRSSFAALLGLGIAQGVLNELNDVMKASGAKIYEWWNADVIAEQKRLEAKRERRRKQDEERRLQVERDRIAYAEHEAKLAAEEAARRARVDGLVHETEFQGDEVNFPVPGQYARVHYTGAFEKGGEIFESTRKRGGALEFCIGAGHLIKGFDLALQRMSVGETAKVTMAPMLAYGVKGRPPKIPPNATLVFKIELISIKEKLHLAQDVGAPNDDDDR